MPIYEFDEFENSRPHPETGELLVNYWGYSTRRLLRAQGRFRRHRQDRDAG